MRIGICDDEQILRRELIALSMKYKENNPNMYEIISFSSGEELLEYQETIDILFLDIQMGGFDGIQTALRLRQKDESVLIIFLSAHSTWMQEGYRVKAFRYLLKPLKFEAFIKTMDEAIEDLTKNTKVIVGKDNASIFLKLKEIIYIEYQDHCTIVRTKRDCFESSFTMIEWERTLNTNDFYRVHKAYIVNIEYVEEIGKNITMENGEKVEISLRKNAKFKQACKEYRRRHAR